MTAKCNWSNGSDVVLNLELYTPVNNITLSASEAKELGNELLNAAKTAKELEDKALKC